MAEFNINGSKIEQLNDTGSNVKISGASGSVAVAQGDVIQTTGNENRVQVGAKESFWATLWKKIKGVWSAIFR